MAGEESNPSRGVPETGEPGKSGAAALDLFRQPLALHPDQVEGAPAKFGAGRPKGSKNRTTEDLARLVQQLGGHPVLAMARVVGMSIEEIKLLLGCSRAEAFDRWWRACKDVAPYVASQMPVAVAFSGKVATLNIGVPLATGQLATGPDAVFAMFDAAARLAQAEGFQLALPTQDPVEENDAETDA